MGSVRLAWLQINDVLLLAEIEFALIEWFKPRLNRALVSKSEPVTGMKNKIDSFIKQLGVSAYRFTEDTGITKNTVYSLKNNPLQFPSGDVFDRIITTYKVTPGDIVEWVPEESTSDV